jgi:hypothetical protein
MKASAGVVAGFAAGVALAVVAVVCLRIQENITRERDSARVAELEAQVRRLEQSVTRLSEQVASNRQMFAAGPVTFVAASAREAAEEGKKEPAARALVSPNP